MFPYLSISAYKFIYIPCDKSFRLNLPLVNSWPCNLYLELLPTFFNFYFIGYYTQKCHGQSRLFSDKPCYVIFRHLISLSALTLGIPSELLEMDTLYANQYKIFYLHNKCISSPTYKNVVTQKVQLFRRAKKHIFKGALSNEFVLFQNVVSPGSEP